MKIHMIGIGGVSMSGLAVFLKKQGHQVSGCDAEKTKEMAEPKNEGIEIRTPNSPDHITDDLDLVVFSSAVSKGSPGEAELARAKERGIKTLRRAAIIGQASKDFFTITISGTHGKTTTSAMIAKVLLDNNFDPSFLLGAPIKGQSSVRLGQGEYLVLEADEFDRSFLEFESSLAVILNIDEDHLDYFKGGLPEIKTVFKEFIEKNIVKNGTLIYSAENPNLVSVIKNLTRVDLKLIPFSKEKAKKIPKLKIPGEFNRLNGAAAKLACLELGLSKENIDKSLQTYEGVERRFEKKGERNGVEVYDDYAHHPTAIKKTLEAAREKFAKKRIIVVFQSLHHTRTRLLFGDFARAFASADMVIITKICYGIGREKLGEISEEKLAHEIAKESKARTEVILDFGDVADFLKKNAKPGEIIITMGAYPVREVAELFLKS